jgi:hypothetical protein
VISLTVPPTPADANPVVARLLAAAGNLKQPQDFMCRWRRGIKARQQCFTSVDNV